jgi:O-antigen/teichoic acid export membrane protein
MLRPLILKTLITNFGLAFLGLANSVLLSRWLGPTGRGEVAAAMLWPTMLVYLSSLGLIMATMYFAALPESRPQALFANSTLLGVVQGTLAAVIGFAILPWVLRSQASEVVSAARLFLLVIPISLITQYGVSILQGRLHISSFNWLRMILPSGYIIGTVILVIAGRLSLFNIILLHLFLNSIGLIGTLIALSRAGVKLSLKPDADLAKEMLKYGGKVHVGNISGSVNLSLDQVLMAAWLPPVALGLYVAAVSSAGLSQVFSQAVQMVSTPSITQRETLSERASVLQGIFRSYWLLSFLITVAIGALLPVAIPLVFGASFKGAIWPAEVLLAGMFFLGAQVVLAGGAQALGNPWLGSKANVGALIVTVTLLYFLLPRFGILGAASATTAAYFTQLMIVVYGLRNTHGIPMTGLFRVRFTDVSSALNIIELIRGPRKRLVTDQS